MDDTLVIARFRDACLNGLEIQPGRQEIKSIAGAVDPSLAVLEAARAQGADMLLLHHGIFFGSQVPLRGAVYEWVKSAVTSGIGVYAAHLPLDAHADYGNNVLLARALEMPVGGFFASHGGAPIGVYGQIGPMSREELVELVTRHVGPLQHAILSGSERIEKLAIVSGAAASDFEEAMELGVDALLTGETTHTVVKAARDAGFNILFGGHYQTETLGVTALGEHLADRFNLTFRFIDDPSPF